MSPYRDSEPAEHRPVQKVRFVRQRSLGVMKLVILFLGGLVVTLLTAVLGWPFVYFGWNHGVVSACDFAHGISALQALCMSLFLAGVGAVFKSSLTVNSKE